MIHSLSYWPAEFLKWNSPPSIFGTVHYKFLGISRRELEIWSANSIEPGQNAGWPGYILVAKAITFGFGRIRVNKPPFMQINSLRL